MKSQREEEPSTYDSGVKVRSMLTPFAHNYFFTQKISKSTQGEFGSIADISCLDI